MDEKRYVTKERYPLPVSCLQFLLFPEGIDYCARGLAKSKSFAEKNGFPMYEYVLHPRTTGFIHFVSEMRKSKATFI